MAAGTHSCLVHATCIAVDGRAALLLGASRSGKSDLALRAITGRFRHGDRDLTADLVADDQVLVERRGPELIARAPATIAGRIEARGLGILTVPCLSEAPLRLAVELVEPALIERMPERRSHVVAGFASLALPLIALSPFEVSAPVKLIMALLRTEPDCS